MKTIGVFLVCLISFSLSAQFKPYKPYKRPKPKKSYAAGTMSIYWGYNRSAYTKSNIEFIGPGYDFTLNRGIAKDRPEKNIKTYFDPRQITVPQFNFRVGYTYKNNWQISLGYDHLKYVLQDTTYTLSGHINYGVDNVNHWSGNFNGDTVHVSTPTFHYENTNGLNYIRLELARVDQWYRSQTGNFAISTLIGGSTGMLLSFNDFTFAGRKDVATVSVSGLGFSAHVGGRFEFFKHLFFQVNGATGGMVQMRVRTRPNDVESYAKQKFMYGTVEAVIGGFIYIRPKNDCNSCPHW